MPALQPIRPAKTGRTGTIAAVLVFALAAGLGFWNLGGWLMNDDEGAYLYSAWRMSLGETPYRDFTIVQMPLALGIGAALFRLTGPEVWPARALSLIFILGAAGAIFLAGLRFLGLERAGGAAAAGIFLFSKHIFFLGRSFMPDDAMLFFAALALYFALKAESGGPEDTPLRPAFLAGFFAGLAALAKLNGILVLAGYGLFLVYSAARRWGPLRLTIRKAGLAAAGSLISFGLPYGLLLAFVPRTFALTLGFHVGRGGPAGSYAGHLGQRVAQLLGNHTYAMIAVALAGMILVSPFKERRRALLLMMAVAGTAMIALPGKFFLRYVLVAFIPLALFFAVGLRALIDLRNRLVRGAAIAVTAVLLLLCLMPTLDPAKILAYDKGTRELAALVEKNTAATDLVFGDDPLVNFLAGRACPPRLVDVSEAMVRSGRVTAAVIREECERAGVKLIFVERGHSAHHLAGLPDRAAFQAYLAERFVPLAAVRREFLDVDLHVRR